VKIPEIKYCPGTLAEGFNTYSRTCLKKMFFGKKINHILDYNSPVSSDESLSLFEKNLQRVSVSGVQEKFSLLLEKNKLRLVNEGEKGTYILKPVPLFGKHSAQMPANEHLTMQIASQVYGVETADNALIFFNDGSPAYITKRFDVNDDGSRRGQEDFASLAGRTSQTHGDNYKYHGNYLELFNILKTFCPSYKIEAHKLFKQIMFNYLFSNGDAHFKNFSLTETPLGDYKLSPAYDLLNSKIHIEDKVFALDDGLLPKDLAQGKIRQQFLVLSDKAGLNEKHVNEIIQLLTSGSEKVERLINASYLNKSTKSNYWQSYQRRLKLILK